MLSVCLLMQVPRLLSLNSFASLIPKVCCCQSSTMPKRVAKKSTEEESNKKSKKNAPEEEENGTESNSTGELDDGSIGLSPQGESFNLKVISWNVNGIRAALKNGAMDFLKSNQCDILCLQETKCNDKTLPAELKNGLKEFPYKYYHFSQQDGYAGVSLFSKTEPSLVEYGLGHSQHDNEGRVITAHFHKFVIVTAYTPNSGRGLPRLDYRIKEWDKDFGQHLARLDAMKPVILCGDLNVAHKEIDLENPKTNTKTAGFTPQERESFSRLLETGFVDSYRVLYPTQRGSYTFWSYLRASRSKNIGWRLDYFILSERLKDHLCDSRILNHVLGSDHCPIVLYLAL